jgi:outer membrane protein assembly factor BamB
MGRSIIRGGLAVAAGIFFLSVSQLAALAQVPRAQQGRVARAMAPEGRDDELSLDGVFPPPDRASKRRLDMAGQMLEEQRYGEAVRLLGSLLESAEDYFFKPTADAPVYRSLKAEAGRIIGTLEREGRESYELQFGARAKQALRQAAADGDATQLADISRQFFFTQAGADATYLLGRHHLDQNRPLAAAMCFERLRGSKAASDRLEPALSVSLASCWVRAGKPEKAKEALARLKRDYPRGEIVVGGKNVKLFANESKALAWLGDTVGEQQAVSRTGDGWALFRGDENRNATTEGDRPLLNVRWRQRTADDRSVEKFVTKLRGDYISQEMLALPSFHPLAVGGVVLMRTAFATQAVDFASGKLVWRYPASDESFEQFLKVGAAGQQGQNAQLYSGLAQRVWEDAIYGTMASDGDSVYFVDDLGLGLSASPGTTIMHNGRRVVLNANPRTNNLLVARELRTQGKLKWQVGGTNGEDEPKLAGAFFLGPPLPLSGQLYVLAEMKGQEIRVVALNSQTGAMQWSQQLAVVEQPVGQDSYRRNAGAVPSYADGVLVCPTSAGAVVGLDMTTRSLSWGYQYPRSANMPDRFNAARFAIYPGQDRQAGDHWVDGTATIVDGRALLTPVDSDQLFCLNLADGKELWKQDRGSSLYVACVHRGHVVLVGRNGISAVNLSNGSKAWPDIELPSGSMPSGRGFASGDNYFLPLTSAEVARFDLQAGRLVDRSRSRSGHVPGNLICYRDSVVSQGVDSLETYYQLGALKKQIAKTLAERPDDPRALAASAEVKLDEGALGEAVELLRKSYALKNDETTRQNLVSSLLEELRVDFKAHRGVVEELDRLIDRDEDRLAYLRLLAAGLQASGETLPAFEAYLKLADHADPQSLDAIDNSVAVRRDRWIRAQLEQLRGGALAEDQGKIDAVVSERLKTVLSGGSTDQLRGFLAMFGFHPAANAARAAVVSRLDPGSTVEYEMLTRKLDGNVPDEQLAPLVARLARMLEESGRSDLAAIYYKQLGERFARLPAVEGKSGAEVVAALAADSPVRKSLGAAAPWPQGRVESREEKPPQQPFNERRPQRLIELQLAGTPSALFRDMNILLDTQQGVLVGQDGLGEKRFRIPVADPRGRPLSTGRFNPYGGLPLSHASATGGVLMLLVGNQVLAIDALRGADQGSNRVLWVADLGDSMGGFSTGQSVYPRPVPLAWGETRHVAEDAQGRRYGALGPVSDDDAYFQRLRDLHCVDPLTGKIVWVRRNVGLGNQLFGDSELLFVAPGGDSDTLVLRAATGELLGHRRIAPFEKRMAVFGRRVLSWEQQGNQFAMQMRDAWKDEVLWSHTFVAGSKADVQGQDAVAVLQPDGRLKLIQLDDGKVLVDEAIEPETGLTNMQLMRCAEQYVLITNSAARNEANFSVQPLPGTANSPFVNGRMYAFAVEDGKKLWPAPVMISQYSILPAQPSQLPLLVFVRQISKPAQPPRADNKMSILCIDRRTGRVVYENEQLPPPTTGTQELSGNPAAHTVTLNLGARIVELKFTDEPVPADGATSNARGPDKRAGIAGLRIFQDIVEFPLRYASSK